MFVNTGVRVPVGVKHLGLSHQRTLTQLVFSQTFDSVETASQVALVVRAGDVETSGF